MPTSKTPYSTEGYALMGAAFDVQNVLGSGLVEEIYHQALEIELQRWGIPFLLKQPIKAFYKNVELERKYIPDLLVHRQIVVELKAVSALAPEHDSQLITYLRISRSPVGYLINFAPMSKLEYKRYIFSEFADEDTVRQ